MPSPRHVRYHCHIRRLHAEESSEEETRHETREESRAEEGEAEVTQASRFSYVKYDDASAAQQAELKAAFEAVEALVAKLQPGRAQALVLTKLEEAYMWTGKAIRDAQCARLGTVDEQPNRSDE